MIGQACKIPSPREGADGSVVEGRGKYAKQITWTLRAKGTTVYHQIFAG